MKRILLVAALALSACAAPSSYEGLAGGTKEDAAVSAPRPVSPISVSLIASSRPRLRWDLGNVDVAAPLTGAIVEMSRTREFAKDVKRFEAKGTELVVPEDLELGVWFWRLKGNANGSVGTTPSVIWEMVVRGPAAHGSSNAPTRSMVDMNADGIPDLYIAGTCDMSDPTQAPVGGPSVLTPPASTAPTAPMIELFAGDKDGGFAMSDAVAFDSEVYEGPVTIGGGTDFDGDGITDVIRGGFTSGTQQGLTFYDVDMIFGTATSKTPFDLNRGGMLYFASSSTALPSVREGGDVDGDGYGDAVVGLQDVSFVMLGNAPTSAQFGSQPAAIPMLPDMPLGTSRVAMGAFDANGDGLSDVAFSFDSSFSPSTRAFAAAGSHTQRVTEPMMLDGDGARNATAFAAGDYNGDGLDDIAIATPFNDSTRICMWFGDRDKLLTKGPCVVGSAGTQELGASLTAADIEGDGVDELLATVKTDGIDGVRVIRVDGSGSATVAPIGVPGVGVRLTTIWPGRPGKARWAAVAADGSRVAVFEGADLKTSIGPGAGIIRGFGRGLR
ncbi:MAG: hypothetical protein QOI41_7420 [Myxococcales bacterium]|nr:hypothetical protein [Myxococcales bacterium]